MAKREYTDDQRDGALGLVAEHGFREAHRRSGIPLSTLFSWGTAAGVRSVQVQKSRSAIEAAEARIAEKREIVRELLLEKAADLIERMDEPHKDFKGSGVTEVTYDTATSTDVRNYSVAAAVLIDKHLLMSGEATERIEGGRGQYDRLAEVLGVAPEDVPDEVARRRAAKREAS